MVYLDLAELDEVFRGRWLWSTRGPACAWFRRADYLGNPEVPLDQAVRDRVEAETGRRPTGPIRLLTHLRYFGVCFNPVSFYYCFDTTGEHLEAIVAEITNTPWNERHAYVLSASIADDSRRVRQFRLDKRFHVSPFMEMELEYDWRFSPPGETLLVHMRNLQQATLLFDATLTLERRAMSTANLARVLAVFPLMTARVLGAIYFQALQLWLKRIPVHDHPTRLAATKPDGAAAENRR
jgi:DUF1365 family protein